MRELQGTVALVTGASSGIGRAAAVAFARAGARVVVADVDDDRGPRTVALVEEAGGQAVFVHCDVSRSKDCEAAVTAATRAWGRLDSAFNNAGIEGVLQPCADYPEEVFRRVIDVNVTGQFLCMKYEIPAMLAAGGGAIVNCASVLGRVAFANAGAYVAAKHGLLGLTKSAALEYATNRIRVNAVCPGFIETPMLERAGLLRTETRGAIEALHPMKRLGTAEEIAEAVVFLCSKRASFITGEALLIDGGYVAQ
jgi:NAD(P)-dependent dehydrogenase (short-subunit alcohol dehydrogenase family)